MAFDSAPNPAQVAAPLTERARFALWLAQRPNEAVGQARSATQCPLAVFFERASPSGDMWQFHFAFEVDHRNRRPTGFDCLCILQRIPA